MNKCKSCGAEIDFVWLENGRWMPVEGERIAIGDAQVGDVLVTDGGKVVKVNEINKRGSFKGRISHFATCPQAEQLRREA